MKEIMNYYAGNTSQWKELNDNFHELEDFLIENCKSKKLQGIEIAKKIMEDKEKEDKNDRM